MRYRMRMTNDKLIQYNSNNDFQYLLSFSDTIHIIREGHTICRYCVAATIVFCTPTICELTKQSMFQMTALC
jgi:hypothetical protein